MAKLIKNILSESDCLSVDQMYQYVGNKLTKEDRYHFEKHLASCGLCSDALEGLSSIPDRAKIKEDVSSLNKRITEKSERKFAYLPLAIAASVSIILLVFGLLFKSSDNTSIQQEIAVTAPEKTEAILKNNYEKDESDGNIALSPPVIKEDVNVEEKEFIAMQSSPEVLKDITLGDSESDAMVGNSSVKSKVGPSEEMQNQNAIPVSVMADKTDREEVPGKMGSGNKPSEDLVLNEMLAYAENSFATNESLPEVKPTTPVSAEAKKLSKRSSDTQSAGSRAVKKSQPSAPRSEVIDDVKDVSYLYGKKKYEEGDYKKAEEMLSELVANEPEDINAKFYLAMTKVQLGKSAEALPHVKYIIKGNSPLRGQAMLLEAIILLHTGDKNGAEHLLTQITKQYPAMKHKAEEFLMKLH